jgi:hypothetical protein
MRTPDTFTLLALPVLGLAVSCASIVGKPDHVMPIRSVPSEADILIRDEGGKEMFKGRTPSTVILPKSTGKYWGKKTYAVTLTKQGYQDQNYTLSANANGWYIGGNIVFGGLIGWFLVGPFNGKMYTMAPEAIDANLPAANPPAAPSSVPAAAPEVPAPAAPTTTEGAPAAAGTDPAPAPAPAA